MDQRVPVEAEQASADERQRLWDALLQVALHLAGYQEKSEREIAMFILRPQAS
jgi:hypothetical protein